MPTNYPLGHLKISSGDVNEVSVFIEKRISEGKKAYCIPLNLTKYVMSKKDKKLQEVINSADLIVSDGISMVWLSRRVGYQDVCRVTGIELAEKILFKSKKLGWRLFFLGASPENLNKAIDNIEHKYNNPAIVGYQHGYFKQNEIEEIITNVNESKSDILLIGMGLPQKEYFIHDYLDKINVKFCLAVGGAFDVWSGVKKRTPKLIQRVGLEWLFRSYYDKSRSLHIAKYGLIYFKDIVLLGKNSFLKHKEKGVTQDHVTAFYDEIVFPSRTSHKAYEELVLSSLNGMKVGDFGCGQSLFINVFKKLKSDAIFLDISRRALETIDYGKKIHASLTDIPLENNYMDIIYCIGVVHHIPEMERAISELARVLKEGGKLYLGVYSDKSFQAQIRKYYDSTNSKSLKRFIYSFTEILIWFKNRKIIRYKSVDNNKRTDDLLRTPLVRYLSPEYYSAVFKKYKCSLVDTKRISSMNILIFKKQSN